MFSITPVWCAANGRRSLSWPSTRAARPTHLAVQIEICKRVYDLLVNKVDFRRRTSFLIRTSTVATGIDEHNNYAVDFINTVRWIKENLLLAKVSGGVSNILLPRQQCRA